MSILRSLWNRLRFFGNSDSLHGEMDDEFTFHIERKAEDLMRGGVPESEARALAARSFGHKEQWRERGIDFRGAGFLEQWWSDLQFSLRLMRKAKARTLIVIATLSLGIAMSASIFGILRDVVLQPLPFAKSGELVVLHQAAGNVHSGVSYPHFRDWKAGAHSFTDLAVYSSGDSTIERAGKAERVLGATVSAGIFDILQVTPLRGRLFRREDDRRGASEGGERPLIISDWYWRSRVGAREDIVGQHLKIDGFIFRVVGVIPSRVAFPITSRPLAFWSTVAVDAEPSLYGGTILEARGYPRYDAAIGRLKARITLEAARADMARLAAVMAKANPGATSMNDVSVEPALRDVVGDTRRFLLLLYGAVLAVLLVSCANASTLVLVSSLGRRREFGIRSALGAPSRRLFRQIVFENALLGLLSGIVALPLSAGLVYLCVQMAPPDTPRLSEVHVDAAVFCYALLISLVAGLGAGCLPAFFSSRRDVACELSEGGRSTIGKSSVRAGALLISGQIALCMVLACAAALLTSSFLRILSAPRGFDPHAVLTASIDLPVTQYAQRSEKVRHYYRSLLRDLSQLPTISAASLAERVPLSGTKNSTTFQIAGRETPQLVSTDLCFVDPTYFRTLKIPLISGRTFEVQDNETHPPVAVVNRAFVRQFFPGENAGGRLLKLGWGGNAPKRIVGVVNDLKTQAFDVAARPEVYVPAAQFPNNSMTVLLRTSGSIADAAAALRQAVARLDPSVPLDRIKTLDEYLIISVATQRFLLTILAIFAASTIAIAAIGLYGLLSYVTERRQKEFGIRMALGSHPAQLLRLVLCQGLLLAVVGIAAGALLSVTSGKLLSTWLYETEPGSLESMALPAAVLLLAALTASFTPAKRASKVDPLSAIRAE